MRRPLHLQSHFHHPLHTHHSCPSTFTNAALLHRSVRLRLTQRMGRSNPGCNLRHPRRLSPTRIESPGTPQRAGSIHPTRRPRQSWRPRSSCIYAVHPSGSDHLLGRSVHPRHRLDGTSSSFSGNRVHSAVTSPNADAECLPSSWGGVLCK